MLKMLKMLQKIINRCYNCQENKNITQAKIGVSRVVFAIGTKFGWPCGGERPAGRPAA